MNDFQDRWLTMEVDVTVHLPFLHVPLKYRALELCWGNISDGNEMEISCQKDDVLYLGQVPQLHFPNIKNDGKHYMKYLLSS